MGFTINDFAGRTGWGVQGQISGDQVLDGLGFGSNHLWQSFLGLSLLIVSSLCWWCLCWNACMP
jgi:hypothetical protein